MDNKGALLGSVGEEELRLSYDQRRQGTYILGVNGTGKSTLLREIADSDMRQEPKHGVCVIDPHGDLIDDLLPLIPAPRLDDVILFDPSAPDQQENPICLNLFSAVPSPELVGRQAGERLFQSLGRYLEELGHRTLKVSYRTLS